MDWLSPPLVFDFFSYGPTNRETKDLALSGGIEPPTSWLTVKRSASELTENISRHGILRDNHFTTQAKGEGTELNRGLRLPKQKSYAARAFINLLSTKVFLSFIV